MLRRYAWMPLAAVFCIAPAAHAAPPLDLESQEGSTEAMVKMRCSLDPSEDVILWWSGTLFAQLPGKAPSALMGFEGYNICRSEKLEDGTWRLATRELTFYRDLRTGEILGEWDNPLNGRRVEVVDVANDPVNTVLNAPGRSFPVPWVEAGDQLLVTLNIPLSYPNPLQPDAWPEESSGPVYVGSEHFMFFVPRAAMEDATLSQAPVTYGWTRVGPWLPWMRMGQAEGNLLYIGQGNKRQAISELPDDIQALVRERYPEYATAPREWVQPNATSWTEYRRRMERLRGEAAGDGRSGD